MVLTATPLFLSLLPCQLLPPIRCRATTLPAINCFYLRLSRPSQHILAALKYPVYLEDCFIPGLSFSLSRCSGVSEGFQSFFRQACTVLGLLQGSLRVNEGAREALIEPQVALEVLHTETRRDIQVLD